MTITITVNGSSTEIFIQALLRTILDTEEYKQVSEFEQQDFTVSTETQRAEGIQSEVPQPEVVTRTDLPTFQPKRNYHKWTDSDDRTLIECATSSRASIRAISYIHQRFDTNEISENAVRSRLNYLGFRIKKGAVACQRG